MRNWASILFLVSGLLLSGAAAAQPRNPYGGGTRIPEQPEVSPVIADAHRTRLMLEQFSACVVKKHAADVQRYLLEQSGQDETLRLRNRILEGAYACLEADQMQLLPLTLQGGLADAMLRQENLLVQPINVSVIPPLRHSSPREVDESVRQAPPESRNTVIAMDYLFRFGECVVRADVADAYALVRSEPDSAEESAAFGRLMPAFSGCVERNRTLQGGKIELRAAIAYNYYRLAAVAHPENLVALGKS